MTGSKIPAAPSKFLEMGGPIAHSLSGQFANKSLSPSWRLPRPSEAIPSMTCGQDPVRSSANEARSEPTPY
jgi:hypothetical protein